MDMLSNYTTIVDDYPLVNSQLDPKNSHCLVTNLPSPMTARVYVNLQEGNII